jgi:predicted nucleic acid-binding protein
VDIVVDTSVIIAVIANEPQRDRLIELTKGADLIAPYSVYWEVGNAFSAMLRRKRITLTRVLEAIQVFRRIPIRYVDLELEDCLRIAETLGIYAYDAYLIHCAMKYASPLISLDNNLVQGAKRMKSKVIEVNP